MSLDYITLLYSYHYWANERVLQTAEQVPVDLLDEAGRRSYTRILDILVYTVGAEWVWCSRWQGVSPTQRPNDRRTPNAGRRARALARPGTAGACIHRLCAGG